MSVILAIFGAAIFGIMAGLQAFFPLLIVSALALKGVIVLAPGFGWVGTWPAFIIFLLLTIVEHVVDSVPGVDAVGSCTNLLSSPIAGVILALAVLPSSGCVGFVLVAVGVTAALTTVSAKIPTRIAGLAAGPLGALGITAAEDLIVLVLMVIILFVTM